MNYWWLFNLASVACIACAGAMAFKGISGWGWFLFVALLLFCVPAKNDKEN